MKLEEMARIVEVQKVLYANKAPAIHFPRELVLTDSDQYRKESSDLRLGLCPVEGCGGYVEMEPDLIGDGLVRMHCTDYPLIHIFERPKPFAMLGD